MTESVMKIVKYILGALLIPLAIGFSKGFYSELSDLSYIASRLNIFMWGIIIYMLMHTLICKPAYLYTLGHEAIHAVATWLCGGHITSFNISSSGGSVTTSKTNTFIELSPYFVPVYTIILLLIVPFIKAKFISSSFLTFYVMLLGFSLGMHLIMTADVLKLRQPDMKNSGYLFSLVFVYIGNLLVVFFIFSIFSKDLSFKVYLLKSFDYAKDIYLGIWNQVVR